ncbi:50S ribosomal protein L25 [Candidatus Saccharibacteria bacterium]|nr:50S ribosomal protein L25 [Candidatus Saccharibacteria bacterium]
MSEEKLQLGKRQLTGKKLKKLRAEGQIPSVVYGGEQDPILTASPYNITEKVLLRAGYHSPIDLDIDGKPQMALVKDVDIDPVKRTIRNIEFQAISADEIVEATTPIIIVNFEQSEANKIHLAFLQVLEEIDVKAKPADLPSGLQLDAGNLATAEDVLSIADLKLPKGVELADKELDPETTIVTVYDPAIEAAQREAEAKAAAEAAAAEAAASAEPAAETPAPETETATPAEETKVE